MNKNRVSNEVVELRNTVKDRILSLLNRKNGEWVGTMTQLDTAITSRRSVPENWPGSASALRRVVDAVVPSLRKAGVSVRFERTPDHDRKRMVVLTKSR